jgi:hypothetical protein
MLGHFRKAGVPPKRIVKEFPVTPDALVPVGEPPSFPNNASGLKMIRNNAICNPFRAWAVRRCGS